MTRHRDSLFNRAANAFMRYRAERALRRDLSFAATDTAVILVACQNDLLAPEGRGQDLTAGPEAATTACAALARLVSISRKRGLRIVHTPQAGFADRADDRPLCPIQDAMRTRGLFAEGSAGAAPHEAVAPTAGDDMRPPHGGLSAFAGANLADRLRALGMKRLAIVGALADVQVDSTARDAVERGFQTVVVADCCLASSEVSRRRVLAVTLPRLVHAVLPLSAFAVLLYPRER